MRIGIVFPQFEIGLEATNIRDFAQAAEDLGYQHLTSFDQIIGLDRHSRPDWPYVHDAEDMFHEVFVMFGYLAAVTSRIELTTGILVAPMRGTALIAKQAAEVDVLSGGRMRLGVGVGVKPAEFEACGFDFHNRGKRVDEQIDFMRKLWQSDIIDYQGEFHTVEKGGLNPLPIQRPIPIWIGGISKAAIRRTAQLGDGWLPNFQADDFGRRCIEQMWEKAEQYGRDPKSIGIEATVTIIDRNPDQLTEEIEAWRDMGATHVSVSTLPERWIEAEQRWNKSSASALGDPQKHIDAIRKFKEDLPHLFGSGA